MRPSKTVRTSVSGNATDTVIQAAAGPVLGGFPGNSGGATGKQGKIRVLGVVINGAATPGTVVFNSKGSGAGTAISSTYESSSSAPVGAQAGDGKSFLFETNVGEALTVTTAGATGTTTIDTTFEFVPH